MLNRTSRIFRAWPVAGLTLWLALALLPPPAEAFWKKKETEKTPAMRAMNPDKYPDMIFCRGTLQRGVRGAWELDGRPLCFLPETRVSTHHSSGGISLLRDGAQGLVQGYLQEGCLVVYQTTLFELDQTLQGNRFYRQKVSDLPARMPEGAPR